MKKAAITILLLFVLGMALSIRCTFAGENSSNPDKQNQMVSEARYMEKEQLIAQGAYLVTLGGCNDCHSPKIFNAQGMEFDSSRLLSGHPQNTTLFKVERAALQPGNWIQMAPDLTAFAGPWGISFTANLTPDSSTGIGAWTEETFKKTLRTGKHLGLENGRPILPPMPWFNLVKLKDEDLSAMYAYLQSLPPIKNKVPAPIPPDQVTFK